MRKTSGKGRMANEINASSMADIAFLLLIFFLVTTTIVEDKGVLVKLPPWSDEPPPETKVNERNVYSVLVNANNQLLVRGELMQIGNIRDNAKLFISNPNQSPEFAEDPKKAVISLQNDRGTSYETYLEVYNELMAAYRELRDDVAMTRYGRQFDFLEREQRDEIRNEIPLVISEAEPTSFGEE